MYICFKCHCVEIHAQLRKKVECLGAMKGKNLLKPLVCTEIDLLAPFVEANFL